MPTKIFVLSIVNSTFGYKSNIGFRAFHIAKQLTKRNIEYQIFVRANVTNFEHVTKTLPGGAFFPRALNAYRMFIHPSFDTRIYDIRHFEYFTCRAVKKFLETEETSSSRKIAHMWEYSPRIIGLLKQQGFKVILEIPIAHPIVTLEFQNKGIYFDTPVKKIPEYITKSIEFADFLSVPSPYVFNSLVRAGVSAEKIKIIPFGSEVSSGPKKYSLPKNSEQSRIVYGFAGTLSLRKGIQFLLEAWDCSAFEQDKLILLGRTTKNVKRILSQYRFQNVETPGFVKSVKDYLEKCNVYVFPSLMEGSAKSVYEAMSLGLPVITTPNSGSIVEDGKEGFIVPPANSKSLRKKMLFFKNNPDAITSMGKRSYDKSIHYTWQRYADSVISLYQELGEVDSA